MRDLFDQKYNIKAITLPHSFREKYDRKVYDKKWLKAQVPGCVHTDLYVNNIIPDPFYGTNEKDLQWISDESWEYKTILDLDNEFISKEVQLLKFYGLDTYAKVYVN